ncbi:MAG: TetR/AcrR family transcriptional regulator [Bacteroidota bacterium]
MGIIERKEREKEQRKQEIIDAAERIFFNKGYHEATMDEIAAEAELSKGTLYLYFKNKEDLYFEIFLRGMEILINMIRDVLDDHGSGLGNLIQTGQTFTRFFYQHPHYSQPILLFENNGFGNISVDEEKIKNFCLGESPFSIVTNIVEQGIHDGSLRNDLDPQILASTLWSQMLGILTVLNQKKNVYQVLDINIENIVHTHFEVIINGIKKETNQVK